MIMGVTDTTGCAARVYAPAPNNTDCSVVARCRPLNIPVVGKAGFQHCSAVVTNSSGITYSISGGPVNSGPYNGKLGGWVTSGANIPADVYQGTVVYSGNSCQAASCMVGTGQAYESDPGSWPNYNPYLGPNSNDWIKGNAGACGVSLPINTWGGIW